MDTTFDLTTTVAANATGGYSCTQGAALTSDIVVKVKEAAVKRVLLKPLSAQLNVTSFDPTNICNEGNFFNFVGNWHTTSEMIQQHLSS